MKNKYDEFRSILLPLLRCVCCDNSNLQLVKKKHFELPFSLYEKQIFCTNCGKLYPITDDIIPIMWTPFLQNVLTKQNDQVSNIGANVIIYDSISFEYQLHTRQYPELAIRVKNAFDKMVDHIELGADPIFHLDFGCGPGHVLGWLKSQNFVQIGLDVSINNLRNARNKTGAFVVCGDATCMPFADKSIDIVTESSALHHIGNWKSAISESCRICKGGILIDSEPSKAQMDWGPLACAVFKSRFHVYNILSYFMKTKYIFRDIKQAKLNLLAEVHHQPGTGFPLYELTDLFKQKDFMVEIIVSPSPDLQSVAKPGWKSIILNLLSGRNPWNPKYGSFMLIAKQINTWVQ